MRERELREHAICSKCKKPIGHTGLPLFLTLEIKRHGLDMKALERQAGLTMVLGGNALLAQAMGPDEELSKVVEEVNLTLCEECALPVMKLIESTK